MNKVLLVFLVHISHMLYGYSAHTLYTSSPSNFVVTAGSSSESSESSESSSSTTSSSTDYSYDFAITSSMIENSSGLTISTQGNYRIQSEIGFSGSSGTCAITINSSHVTLDLNQRSLSYTGDATSGVHGVCIAAGKKNIIIKNGTIASFAGNGVNAAGTSGSPLTEIKIENVSLVNNHNGFVGSYINGGKIKNCDANNNTTSSGTTYGIRLANSNAFQIHAVNAHHNSASSGACYAISLETCNASSIVQSHIQHNQGSSTTAGIIITDSGSSKNNTISYTISSNNVSTGSNCYGILLQTASYPTIQTCQTNNNQAGATSYGIALLTSSYAHIENNTTGRNTYGIYDDEALGLQTNLFIHNTAYQNGTNFHKVYGPQISSIFVNADHLQDALQAGEKDNISISYR